MRLQFKGLAVFAVALALLLSGCGEIPEELATTATTLLPPTATEQYTQARRNFQKEKNMQLTYTLAETRQVNGESYSHNISGTISVSNRGKENMLAMVKETLEYGAFQFGYMEMFRGGSTYVQVNESGFSAASTPQHFLERQLPPVLLSEELYGNITAEEGENTTRITFAYAKSLEKWLPHSEEAELVSAGGTATLNSNGQLLQTTYRAEYLYGGVQHVVQVTMAGTTPASLELGGSIPEHIDVVGVLDDIDAPKMLLQTVGAVYSAKYINCNTTETIKSEAIPLEYIQQSRYMLFGAEKTLNAEAVHETTLSDGRGNASTKTQTDVFRDGVFTTATNQEEPVTDSQVTAGAVRQSFEDAVLSAVFAPKYLMNAKIEDCGTYYQLYLYGNTAFKKDLMVGITAFLEVDLDAKAEKIQDVAATGYLTVDKATGLPTAMGLTLERIHTLATAEHRLVYSLAQTLYLLPATVQ